MKKILIFGFPHCGTTILRRIVATSPEVFEVQHETKEFHPMPQDFKAQVIKWPFPLNRKTDHKDALKIGIIRDPRFVFSSIKRRGAEGLSGHDLKTFELLCDQFSTRKDVIWIRYEEFFSQPIKSTERLSEQTGLDLRIPESKSASEKPPETDHVRFRLWQVSQPIENMNHPEKLNLSPELEQAIRDSKLIRQVYSC